jgi:hypothetical protein
MNVIRRSVNAQLPGRATFLTGYVAMLAGAVLTVLVQSSSVFTSALTPLVGVGVISLERVYPLTLGSNLGTTTTGILAALAAPSERATAAIQIALCHLLFNLTGIVLFYPVPFMRLPIGLAKFMGNTTARYRWFAIVYLVLVYFAIPLAVFGLSSAGSVVLPAVVGVVVSLTVVVVVVNVLQRRRPTWLPDWLKTWNFLPAWMHSLEPADSVVAATVELLRRIYRHCCCCCGGCVQDDKSVVEEPFKEPSGEGGGSSSESGQGGPGQGPRGDGGGRSQMDLSSLQPTTLTKKSKMWGSASSSRPLLSAPGAGGSESGYSSVVSTPAPSRLPSYAVMEIAENVGDVDEPH